MNDFFKAFSRTGLSSILSMLLGALLVKVIAVFAGPQGIAVFSILRDLSKTAVLAFSLSGNVAIVQGLSSEEIEDKNLYIENILKLFFFSSVIFLTIYMSAISYLHEKYFSGFHDISNITLCIVGIGGFFGGLNVIYIGILNAKRKLGHMALSQVFAAIIGLLFAFPAIIYVPSMYVFSLILL